MIEAVKTFLGKIKDQEHVLLLIHQTDMQVNLHCNQQTIQLIIKNGGIIILQNPEAQPAKNEISGSRTVMKHLLEGTQRLRVLEQQGLLKVSASLRTTLLLESIFFLTKAKNHQLAKII